jgi:hypothetical protein
MGGEAVRPFSLFLRYNIFVSLKLYLVSCEFITGGDYKSFREKLRTLEATEILAHQWALRSRFSALELKEQLRQYLDSSDRITVAEVGEEKASRRARADLAKL